jgi:hypothetical protein
VEEEGAASRLNLPFVKIDKLDSLKTFCAETEARDAM